MTIWRHEFVDSTLPPGMVMYFGRGLAPRRLETPLKVQRCQWCGIVAPAGRRMRCYGRPVKPGAAIAIPDPETMTIAAETT